MFYLKNYGHLKQKDFFFRIHCLVSLSSSRHLGISSNLEVDTAYLVSWEVTVTVGDIPSQVLFRDPV